MEAIRAVQKKYGSRAMASAVIIALMCILLGQTALGKGLVLGTLFSVINFVLMGEILPIKLGRAKKQTFALSLSFLLLRYLLLAVPLILAVKSSQFHLVTTVIGVFMIQFVILLEHLCRRFSPLGHKIFGG